MEGKLVARTLATLAERDELAQGVVAELQEKIETIEGLIDGLGFCLSRDGDLLSQWRGYAADATGVAVGFSVEYLNWLADQRRSRGDAIFTLNEVVYDSAAHQSMVEPTYQEVRKLIDDGAFRSPGLISYVRSEEEFKEKHAAFMTKNVKVSDTLFPLFKDLFCMKSSAFSEEREWRLLSYLLKGGEDPCSFRARDNRIVPYRKVELESLERMPISEVILGPKHHTPANGVADFLRQTGFGDVQVGDSVASYR